MITGYIMNPSERVNMFQPDSTTEDMFVKTQKLLQGLENDDYIDAQCTIQYERIARRTAGIVSMFYNTYGITIEELEKELGLNSLRKSFACKNIDLYEIIDYIASNDNLLANEVLDVITNSDNLIITINL